METMGGVFYCTIILLGIGLIVLFFTNLILKGKGKNKTLSKIIKDKDLTAKKLIDSLEKFGVHWIDTDAEPIEIEGYTVYSHEKNGLVEFNLSSCSFYVFDEQTTDQGMSGHNLHEEIIDKSVANDNFLDFLLSHPHLIPESWPDEVVFWGTVRCKYVDKKTKYPADSLMAKYYADSLMAKYYVRSLVRYEEGVYKSKIKEVDSFFNKNQPAMIMN